MEEEETDLTLAEENIKVQDLCDMVAVKDNNLGERIMNIPMTPQGRRLHTIYQGYQLKEVVQILLGNMIKAREENIDSKDVKILVDAIKSIDDMMYRAEHTEENPIPKASLKERGVMAKFGKAVIEAVEGAEGNVSPQSFRDRLKGVQIAGGNVIDAKVIKDAPEEKKQRYRRTKAEMEADRLKEEEANQNEDSQST